MMWAIDLYIITVDVYPNLNDADVISKLDSVDLNLNDLRNYCRCGFKPERCVDDIKVMIVIHVAS